MNDEAYLKSYKQAASRSLGNREKFAAEAQAEILQSLTSLVVCIQERGKGIKMRFKTGGPMSGKLLSEIIAGLIDDHVEGDLEGAVAIVTEVMEKLRLETKVLASMERPEGIKLS